jgi:molecular chaperone GrpE
MSESAKEQEKVHVKDRRRFDPEGNPREDASAAPETAPEMEVQPGGEAAEAAQPLARDREEVIALRNELEVARKRVDELARAYQALTREREEFKQRLNRERDRMLEVEKGNVAQTLLEAVDELDLCLKASEQDESPLAQGVRLIRDGLISKLQATGIERLELVGQMFDPNLAEAVDMEMTTEPDEDQRILGEVRAGYRLKDRVVRPARVKVAKYVKPAQA